MDREINMDDGTNKNAYVVPPYDYRYRGYIVNKDVSYPRYMNDNNFRVNAYEWKKHQGVYAPLNGNAEMSKEYRKYANDDSGLAPYWYRHTIPPTVNEIYRDTLRRIGPY
jgi:hypothetical protein